MTVKSNCNIVSNIEVKTKNDRNLNMNDGQKNY